MPPKPWETTAANKDRIDSSEIANGTPFSNPVTNTTNNTQELGNNLNNTTDPFNTANGYSSQYSNSYGSGFGSSYGSGYGSSYGSGYGGYGSSYGGYGSSYGGYGSSYGGYGSSYGGYGGYGRGSMFGSPYNRDPNQKGNFMEFALRYLDSFSYGVSSLCEMTRNIEMNAEGLSRFWASMRNIVSRFIMWFSNAFKGGKEFLVMAFMKIKEKVFNKEFMRGLLFSDKSPKEQAINVILRVSMICMALSLLAPLAKAKVK